MSSVLSTSALDTQNKRDNLYDMYIRSVNFNRNIEQFSKKTSNLENFLVVRASTMNKDAELVCDKRGFVLIESADDAFEGDGKVGKVGNYHHQQ